MLSEIKYGLLETKSDLLEIKSDLYGTKSDLLEIKSDLYGTKSDCIFGVVGVFFGLHRDIMAVNRLFTID